MAEITWSELPDRRFDRGLDRGVLYHYSNGQYTNGEAWNGLTAVNETPSGGEPTKQYADNIVYATLMSAEEFGATIEAFSAPRSFFAYDGQRKTSGGLTVGQQSRGMFGFAYRTLVGNAENEALGEKIHLVWGATASPSEKSRNTVNDSPEITPFSWSVSTQPVAFDGFKPISYAFVDSTDPDVTAQAFENLLDILYGRGGGVPRLPMPAEVNQILAANSVTSIRPTVPTGTGNSVTIPNQTGTGYYINGVKQTAGAKTISGPTVVEARPEPGYIYTKPFVAQWFFPGT